MSSWSGRTLQSFLPTLPINTEIRMPTLGANLEELSDLAMRLRSSNAEIEVQRNNVHQQVNSVIGEFRNEAKRAHDAIRLAAENIMAAVERARYEADRADWRGGNQQQFHDAYAAFQRAMQATTSSCEAYFENIEMQVLQMNTELRAYEGTVIANLDQASESTMKMHSQVWTQRRAVDRAMNRLMVVEGVAD